MKTSPILFSSDMIRSLLEKVKKQTRRTQGLEQVNQNPDKWDLVAESADKFIFSQKSKENTKWYAFPKHIEGCVLWVRETYANTPLGVVYKADVCSPKHDKPQGGWKPSIHMPKDAARIFLKIKKVRCERLCDITEDDSLAEGIAYVSNIEDSPSFRNYLRPELDTCSYFGFPTSSFRSLWEKINGLESWKKNPWVFVYEFELIEKPENFSS